LCASGHFDFDFFFFFDMLSSSMLPLVTNNGRCDPSVLAAQPRRSPPDARYGATGQEVARVE